MYELYELKEEYELLLSMMDDPEVDPRVIEDTLEAVQGEHEEIADSYITIIKSLECENDGDAKEIERLQRRMNTRKNNIERIKSAIMFSLESTPERKLKTDHYKLSIAKNGGLKPLKFKENARVPIEFCSLIPDNKKIREALDNGFELDFATFGERGEHLSIR